MKTHRKKQVRCTQRETQNGSIIAANTSTIPLGLKTRRKNEENSRIQQTELYLTIPHMKDQASQIPLYPTIHRKSMEASHNRG